MIKEGVTYIIDLEALNNFIFGVTQERSHDTEITEIYEQNEDIMEDEEGGIIIKKSTGPNSLNITSRTIREVKGSDDSNRYNVKYDMFKMFFNMLASDEVNSFAQELTFNTLLSYGIIKEISNN